MTLVGHTLTVSGERVDEDPLTEQTLKRSFSRKYSIPTDILLDSIKAHLTDFGLLLIRVSYKDSIEIVVDQQENNLNASFPTLYTHPQTLLHPNYLGQPEELARNRDSHRSNHRGAAERRRNTKEGQRPNNCSRSAPASPIQHRRPKSTFIGGPRANWSDDDTTDPATTTITTQRTFVETETRTRAHSNRPIIHSALPAVQHSSTETLARLNPQGHVGIRTNLKELDTESTLLSEHEESFI